MPSPSVNPATKVAPVVYHNGEFVSADIAKVAATDPGFLTGFGVFETLKAIDGEPFALSRHYRRFVQGAEKMGIDVPTEFELDAIFRELLTKNGCDSARLRVTVTPDTIHASAGLLPIYPATTRVITVPFCRNEKGALTGLKTTSYGENKLAHDLAVKAGADEALFGNTAGELCEGSMTNVFVVIDGELLTPPLQSGCLPGVTRELVVELARENGLGFVKNRNTKGEVTVPVADLENRIEEMFLTSSLRDIQPVVAINGATIPTPADGFAAKLQSLFSELVKKTRNP